MVAPIAPNRTNVVRGASTVSEIATPIGFVFDRVRRRRGTIRARVVAAPVVVVRVHFCPLRATTAQAVFLALGDACGIADVAILSRLEFVGANAFVWMANQPVRASALIAASRHARVVAPKVVTFTATGVVGVIIAASHQIFDAACIPIAAMAAFANRSISKTFCEGRQLLPTVAGRFWFANQTASTLILVTTLLVMARAVGR